MGIHITYSAKMKVAVATLFSAAAGAYAAAVDGDALTRIHWYYGNQCSETADARYDSLNPNTSSDTFTKTNVEKFEFVKGSGDAPGYIKVWLWQYFMAGATDNQATPAGSFDDAATNGGTTNTDFRAALDAADPVDIGARPLYQRIELTTGDLETDCSFVKNEAGVVFRLNYKWQACTSAMCDTADAANDSDYEVFADGGTVQDLDYSSNAQYSGTKAAKAYYPFNGDEDGTAYCFGLGYAGLLPKTGGDALEGAYSGTSPLFTSESYLHGNIKPDDAADGSQVAADFDMNGVFEQLCSDSSRTMAVAAISAASVAASLLF